MEKVILFVLLVVALFLPLAMPEISPSLKWSYRREIRVELDAPPKPFVPPPFTLTIPPYALGPVHDLAFSYYADGMLLPTIPYEVETDGTIRVLADLNRPIYVFYNR